MTGVRDKDNMVDPDDGIDYRARCAAMEADWRRLNEFLNHTAKVHRWCSEYEERIDYYNGHFTALKLTGRKTEEHGCEHDPYWERPTMTQSPIFITQDEYNDRRRAEEQEALRRAEIERAIMAGRRGDVYAEVRYTEGAPVLTFTRWMPSDNNERPTE